MSDTATVKKTETQKKDDPPKKDSEPNKADAGKSKMPGAGEFNLTGTMTSADAAPDSDDMGNGERNDVFGNLVTGDEDIVGLVAYSIYKQNKHDWLVAFNKKRGREPNDEEAASYIVGESTQRRLAIYRHLAQATLDGQGPHVIGGPSSEKTVKRNLGGAHNTQAGGAAPSGNNVVGWIIGIAVAVVAIYLAAKYGIPGIQR